MLKEAIVLGGETRVGVATARSLAQHGVKVTVVAVSPRSPGLYSTACSQGVIVTSPEQSIQAYLEQLLRVFDRKEGAIIFPVSDLHLTAVARNWRRIGASVTIASAPPDSLELTWDKWRTLRLADSIGIPTPDSWCADGQADLASWAMKQSYPLVVKPRRSLVVKGDRLVNTGSVQFAFSLDELHAKVREMEDPICQAMIRGTGYGFFALCKGGEVLVEFAHRRIHEVRASGGPSSLRVGIHDETLEKTGASLLRSLKWDGVAMVEFKQSDKNRQFFLMEVNGRFWGSLPLALFSGVDFPWLYYQVLIGRAVPAQKPYRSGVVSRWWIGEMSYLLDELDLIRRNRAKRYVSQWAGKGRANALADFLRWMVDPRVKDDLWVWRDPLPWLMDTVYQAGKVVR